MVWIILKRCKMHFSCATLLFRRFLWVFVIASLSTSTAGKIYVHTSCSTACVCAVHGISKGSSATAMWWHVGRIHLCTFLLYYIYVCLFADKLHSISTTIYFFFICVCLPSSGIYFDNSHGGFVLGCDIYLISAPQQQQKLYIYRSCMSFVVFKEIKLHYGISLLILMIFSFSAEFKNRLHNGLKQESIRKHTDRNNVMAIINDIYLWLAIHKSFILIFRFF